MLKSYKYRLYPTAIQREQIEQHFGVTRLVYNLGLSIMIDSYKAFGASPSPLILCRQIAELREEYPWIKAVNSQALHASLINLQRSYSAFFGGAGFPKFKSKHGKNSFQCKNNTRRIDFDNKTLTIPKIPNIPIVLSRKFSGKIKTVTISKAPTGKYFASILVDTGDALPEKPTINATTTIGIDLGVNDYAITSEGAKFENPKYLRRSQDRVAFLQRRLGAKKKGSNSRKKLKLRVAKLHEKVANQRKDFLHKLSYRLIRDNQTVCLEDLNTAGMRRRCKPKKDESGAFIPNGQAAKSGLNKSIADAGWGMFAEFIKYKAKWYGRNLISIPRFAPSSKRCNSCGEINDNLTLADREWTCPCGAHHDRDINAAINIKYYGLQSCNNITGKPLPEVPAIATVNNRRGRRKPENAGRREDGRMQNSKSDNR